MGYFGGKSRYGADIAKVIRCKRRNLQPIFEPFCGFVNVTQYFYPGPVFASDICKPLILCLSAIQDGWEPPDFISEEEYLFLQMAWKDGEETPLIGFTGFACSWAGKWWGGYARGNSRNYCFEAKTSLLRRMEHCKNIHFEYRNYKNLEPNNSVVYCDPPYAGTTGYTISEWDSVTFWKIMKKWSKNNTVIISEYIAPSDFKIITKFKHFSIRGSTEERLFMYNG